MVADYKMQPEAFFIRLQTTDPEKTFQRAEKLFGALTRVVRKGERADELGFVTEPVTEPQLEEKLHELAAAGAEIAGQIRLADF